VDTDAGKEVAETYAVRGVPTTIVVRTRDDHPNIMTGVQTEQKLKEVLDL
jgi:thioredoxin-like negative regulator of GroEL